MKRLVEGRVTEDVDLFDFESILRCQAVEDVEHILAKVAARFRVNGYVHVEY